jgi:transposase
LKLWLPKSKVRKLINDLAWKQLEVALAEAQHSAAGAPPELREREFLEAMLPLHRTGSPWRDLPPERGHWHAVDMRFRRWEARGVWQRLGKNLPAEPFAKARGVLLDSTTVRAHQHAAGAPKKNGPDQALGRSRGGLQHQRSTRPPATRTARWPCT